MRVTQSSSMKHVLAGLLLLATHCLSQAAAYSESDLASPDQAARDTAAEWLREHYEAIPESQWTPIVSQIKDGMTKRAIKKLLEPYAIQMEGSYGSGQSHSEIYRLDREWTLVCWYDNATEAVYSVTLSQQMNRVWVEPEKDFTGTWITYYVNGQKSHEIEYKEGKYFGKFTAYHPNGAVSCIQHYNESGCDGKDTGYFPTGELRYQAEYRKGKPAGLWKWFDKEGNVENTRQHQDED